MYLHHKKAEKKVCINLNLCIPKEITPIKEIKEIKRVKKVLSKKIIPKKVQKKRVVHPKVKPPLVVPIIKKKIEKPKEIVKEVLETKEIEQKNIAEKVTIKEHVQELNATSKPIKRRVDVAIIQQKKYINNNLEKISQLLSDNLYYPRRARKRGIVGEVVVKFSVLQNGDVNRIKVISSNSDILSRAALKTIEDLSGEFPKPSQDLTIQIPINYSLH
jgi:protein TonB